MTPFLNSRGPVRGLWSLQLIIALAIFLGAALAGAKEPNSAQAKLLAARQYAEDFLKEDARPDQVFFTRQIRFPHHPKQPMYGCAMESIIRAMHIGKAYFESAAQRVVVVPVHFELLMVEVSNDGNPQHVAKPLGNSCKFEYERYSFKTGRFEILPSFSRRIHSEEFFEWGGSIQFSGGYRLVAIDADKRYVRLRFRVNVEEAQPYQAMPNFPKHFYASDALRKKSNSLVTEEQRLKDLEARLRANPADTELAKQVATIEEQQFTRRWMRTRLEASLDQLKDIKPFTDIKKHP